MGGPSMVPPSMPMGSSTFTELSNSRFGDAGHGSGFIFIHLQYSESIFSEQWSSKYWQLYFQVLEWVLALLLGLVHRATLITVKIEISADHRVKILTVVRWAEARVRQRRAPRRSPPTAKRSPHLSATATSVSEIRVKIRRRMSRKSSYRAPSVEDQVRFSNLDQMSWVRIHNKIRLEFNYKIKYFFISLLVVMNESLSTLTFCSRPSDLSAVHGQHVGLR